jgi:predicted patatin/cPLA2 family phospholipase
MDDPTQKIAIVSSGGGMQCVYAAGALSALVHEFGFVAPDIIVATSGSAGNAAYYLARQFDAGREIWTKHLSSPRFISMMRPWRILDVNYLIDTVFKELLPLQVEQLMQTTTEFHIPVLHAKERRVRYISKADGFDIFEVLRAAKALPVFFGQKIDLGGEYYLDGGAGLQFEDTIEYARKLGATRIIAIDTRAPAKRRELRSSLRDDDIVLISARELDVGVVTRNQSKLKAGFELGYSDTLRHPRVQALLH